MSKSSSASASPSHGFGLRVILDTLDLPAFALDAEGRVVGWDEQIADLLGPSREEMLGVTELGARFYDDDQRNLTLAEKVVDEPRNTHETYPEVDVSDDEYSLLSGEFVYEDTSVIDGQRIWFVATPVYDEGEFVGVIEVVQDLRNSARYRDELEDLFTSLVEVIEEFERGNFEARAEVDYEDTLLEAEFLEVADRLNQMGDAVGELIREVLADVQTLQSSAESVAGSSERINELSSDQARNMATIEAEVSDLSATVEEIASTANTVAETSSEAEHLAEEGNDAADAAVEVMEDVADSAGDVTDDVDDLQQRIDDIDEIVEVINDIAEQTNLLALNASIEAARAGEAGDGFAVVADEVKNLAEESQNHASQIEEVVTEIQTEADETVENLTTTTDRIEEGIHEVENTMDRLDEIVEAIAETAEGIQQVSEATDDQAESAEQITAMVDDAVEKADTISESVDDIVANTEQQAEMVEDLHDSVERLKADD